MKNKLDIQLIIACIVTISGLVLLFSGFWVSPTGEIHNSVLVAYGEAMSFVGALLGIDYTYKFRARRNHQNDPDKKEDKEDER